MLGPAEVDRELYWYHMKLLGLLDRFMAGERSLIAIQAQAHADALTCLLEEAPLAKRPHIDQMIDRYEQLRTSCAN